MSSASRNEIVPKQNGSLEVHSTYEQHCYTKCFAVANFCVPAGSVTVVTQISGGHGLSNQAQFGSGDFIMWYNVLMLVAKVCKMNRVQSSRVWNDLCSVRLGPVRVKPRPLFEIESRTGKLSSIRLDSHVRLQGSDWVDPWNQDFQESAWLSAWRTQKYISIHRTCYCIADAKHLVYPS